MWYWLLIFFKMNQKTLFELLGAPLKNYRWSRGATRSDQVIFLRGLVILVW